MQVQMFAFVGLFQNLKYATVFRIDQLPLLCKVKNRGHGTSLTGALCNERLTYGLGTFCQV